MEIKLCLQKLLNYLVFIYNCIGPNYFLGISTTNLHILSFYKVFVNYRKIIIGLVGKTLMEKDNNDNIYCFLLIVM